PNECPDISSVVARGGTPKVGSPVTLVATAEDGDHAPKPLTYTWLADSGVVADLHAPTTTFTCTEPGLVTVVLSVSDGDLQCDQFFGLKIDCAPACADGGIPDSAVCKAAGG